MHTQGILRSEYRELAKCNSIAFNRILPVFINKYFSPPEAEANDILIFSDSL